MFYGDGIDQLVVQVVIAWPPGLLRLVNALIALALRATIGWRVTDDDEVAGIDSAEHAESGYDLVARGGRIGTASTPELSHDARHHDELTSEGVTA